MKRYDKISTYFKENWYIVLPLVITALLFDGLMCFVPRIEGSTINSLNDQDYNQTLHLVIIFISLVLFVQINRFFKRYLVRVFANKMTLRMRRVSLNNLLKKDISYFSKYTAGDILNRNLSDIYDSTEGIRKMTTEVFDTIVLLCGYLISMFFMDYKITLYVLIFIVLSILASHYMKKFVYKTNKDYKEYLSVNKQITLTNLNNELNYRGFGVSSTYYEDYAKSTEILRKKSLKTLIYQSSLEPVYSSIALMGIIFIAYFGGLNVINGVYKIGTLSAYITTFLLVSKKAAKVGKAFNAYQAFKVSWKRCKDYLGNDEQEVCENNVKDITLELENFSYEYKDSFKLPSINLKCTSGDIVGICGRVHTGKSTILKALTGLYEYQGSAKLSNSEMSSISKDKIQYVSYCASDVSMFSDTVENNIKLGRDGNLEKALSVSKIDDDLEEIGGLQALMSHTTSNISGGQQKRVQMARALYPSTPLVLLDDPFQSVNKELATQMVNSLKEYKNEIILLVSNNVDVIKETSKIIYLQDDKAYVDTFDELLKVEGFRKLMGVN